MKKFIAGRVEVFLGYDFEMMDKNAAIEKCKELGPEWRLPDENEIRYICGNLAYGGSLDFWTSTGTIGQIVSRRGGNFNEPVYWVGNPEGSESSFIYDCQFIGTRSFQASRKWRVINSVLLAVREI